MFESQVLLFSLLSHLLVFCLFCSKESNTLGHHTVSHTTS
jgi:hypothetical protein